MITETYLSLWDPLELIFSLGCLQSAVSLVTIVYMPSVLSKVPSRVMLLVLPDFCLDAHLHVNCDFSMMLCF